jgi:Domain of unknown function (DUF4431)
MMGQCVRGLGAMAGVLLGPTGAEAGVSAKPSACLAPGDQVVLDGRVRQVSHVGPPNYTSIRHGDAREVHAVMFVDKPPCVSLSGPGGERRQVRRLHLVDGPEQRQSFGQRRCQRACTRTGHLMVAESGHHHTPVLLELD